MSRKVILILWLVCAFVGLSAQMSQAAIYKYMDKDGLVCIANDLQSIPEQYRSSAMIVTGNVVQEKDQASHLPSAGQQDTEAKPTSIVSFEKSSALRTESPFKHSSLLLSAIILVSAVFAFLILGVLETDHKKAVTILRITILWGVTVYLFYAHSGDVVRLVTSVNGGIESVQKESAEKGRKAANAVKTLNNFVDTIDRTSVSNATEAEREK